jgi:hypothetical protein
MDATPSPPTGENEGYAGPVEALTGLALGYGVLSGSQSQKESAGDDRYLRGPADPGHRVRRRDGKGIRARKFNLDNSPLG